jgi:hypothetical protein
MTYESGWGKKLSYVLAFSIEECVDVTRRYTRKMAEVLARRSLVPEGWLQETITALDAQVYERSGGSEYRQAMVLERKHDEQQRMEHDLAHDDGKRADGAESKGRVSGDAEWKAVRGEGGAKAGTDGNEDGANNDEGKYRIVVTVGSSDTNGKALALPPPGEGQEGGGWGWAVAAAVNNTNWVSNDALVYASPHALYTLYTLMHTVHSSHTRLSCTPLMHSSHALLSCTPLMHSSHALLSSTPLLHSSPTLLSCTPFMH